METFPTALVPLAGGHSGETFLAEVAGEQVVVRIYGPRSQARGPLAPEIDAAVLGLVHGLLPVARVLEVRRGDPVSDLPGLLVTSRLPGERLDAVLPGLDRADRLRVGAALGTLVGRLGHMALPRPGVFADRELVIAPMPPHAGELPAWVEHHAGGLGLSEAELADLWAVADRAQVLLDRTDRCRLVHSDLNPRNVLVDPELLAVTGLVDWEFAHAGSPYADLGNLLRFERDPAFVDGVLGAYTDFMPTVPDDLLERARAADLFALVELATRREHNPTAARAHAQLRAVARTGDLHAMAAPGAGGAERASGSGPRSLRLDGGYGEPIP